MSYLSKETIISAYKSLSQIDGGNTDQGLTQKVSALKYAYALDVWYRNYGRDCDLKVAANRDLFAQNVGKLVQFDDDNCTKDFYTAISPKGRDYDCGSNFYSQSSVKDSKNAPATTFTYPKRSGWKPVMDVENQVLKYKSSYFAPAIEYYLPTNELRFAFIIWTLRNRDIASEDWVGITTALNNIHTAAYCSALIPTDSTFLSSIMLNFSNDRAVITRGDIDALFSTVPSSNSVSANNILQPVIFYGAPGTGKTRYVQEEIYSNYLEDDRIFTTFHQSYCYEDFVEGLKPILDTDSEDVKYHIESGVFYNACERAAILAGYTSLDDCLADTNEHRTSMFEEAVESRNIMLLCIDEINRGNVASIFGDLISLIEPSKRLGAGKYELTLTLPYSKKQFGVPANLYIVGTMNTADRSIQLLDSALRRRFRFVELCPDYSVFKVLDGDASKVLKRINARIRCLLNKDNQIGHSYLMNAENNKQILDAIVLKIIPLLEEYFYNDINKVRFVLNETDSTKYPFYVEDKEAKESFDTYLSMNDIDDEDKSFYVLNESIANLDSEEECGKYIKHLLGEDE